MNNKTAEIITLFAVGIVSAIMGAKLASLSAIKDTIAEHNYAEFGGKVYYCQEFSFKKTEEEAK
jgi:hypothetical protein